jgi:maltooligosyltrehalose trehalohydrolase
MYRDLLTLRRGDPSLAQQATRIQGVILGEQSLALRFMGARPSEDRLMIVNLAPDINIAAVSDPLCAPPEDCAWSVLWCSEDTAYGGGGIAACTPPRVIVATGHATTIFTAQSAQA